jgi:hypothetical protein
MRWFHPLFVAGESLLDRILCVIGAVLFSQAPEFMQQYLQRLGGHLAEARQHLAQYEELARPAGRTVQELAAQYAANPDPAVAGMGRLAGETEVRVQVLSTAEAAIREASALERPFVFLQHMDLGIARATGEVFKPAVPTTVEGLLYALTGVVVLLVLYHGLIRPLGARTGRLFRPKPVAKTA